MQMSLRYSTLPRALRGALSMLTMLRLALCLGSSSPIATPSSSLVGAGAAKACAADERRARGNFDCRDHREKPSSSSCAQAITCGSIAR